MKSFDLKRSRFISRLPTTIISLTAIILLIALSLIHFYFRGVLFDEVLNRLTSVADNRGNTIKTYVEERKDNVTILANMPIVVKAVIQLSKAFQSGIDSIEYQEAEKLNLIPI